MSNQVDTWSPEDTDPATASALFELALASTWIHSGASSTGKVRADNQDRFVASNSRILMVADGMGGHSGGALAAATAVATFPRLLGSNSSVEECRYAAQLTNEAVLNATRAAGHHSAGSTMVAVVVMAKGRATIVNAGDSRVYRSRAGSLELMTTDQNLLQEVTEAGYDLDRIRKEQVPLHGLVNYLGRNPHDFSPEVLSIDTLINDRLLLSSDGVHQQVPIEQIADILSFGSPEVAASELVRQADEAGGFDNATALVAHAQA